MFQWLRLVRAIPLSRGVGRDEKQTRHGKGLLQCERNHEIGDHITIPPSEDSVRKKIYKHVSTQKINAKQDEKNGDQHFLFGDQIFLSCRQLANGRKN